MTDQTLPSNLIEKKSLKKLTHKQLLSKLLPSIQHRLIEILDRWQAEYVNDDMSEKDLKTLLSVMNVTEKLMTLHSKVNAEATMKTKISELAENGVANDYNSLRKLVEGKFMGLIQSQQ